MKILNILPLISFFIINQAPASIYERGAEWDKDEIVVCFLDDFSQLNDTTIRADNESSRKQKFTPNFLDTNSKDRIKKVINTYYTKKLTGISFIGWKNCSESNEYDVMLMRGDKYQRKILPSKKPEFNAAAFIGDPSKETKYYHPKIKKGYIIFNKINDYVISHEFGHVAGLRHEHVHPDAVKVEKNCNAKYFTEDLSTAVILEYDSASIMNYCRMPTYQKDSASGALSHKDMKTLKELYRN